MNVPTKIEVQACVCDVRSLTALPGLALPPPSLSSSEPGEGPLQQGLGHAGAPGLAAPGEEQRSQGTFMLLTSAFARCAWP